MNNDKIKYNVAIYLRLSNEDQDKNSKCNISESIKNQRNMLIDYINRHSNLILFDEYCDEDLSGAGTYRPQFERLINDCQKGKIDIVLCKSQSRFSRDMEVIEKYLHNKFIEWNIRFIGLSDNADTENFGNKKSRQINGLVNEWFLEDTSNNIRSAFLSKMKQGEYISPFAAFGYEISKIDNNKLVIDLEAAEIVQKIYFLYLKGYGFTKIANYLNDNNIPSPSLYKYQKGIKLNINSKKSREQIKWSANTIKTILTNELYTGNLIQGKRTTISYKNHKIKKKSQQDWIKKENTHKAIIDKDTFNKVQIAMKERTKPIRSSNNIHNLSGKVFCLECQKYMRKKNSKLHEYLVCTRNNDKYNKCINRSSIRYDTLEKIILKELNKIIKEYYDENYLKGMIITINKNHYFDNLKSLENKKVEIERKILENKKYLNSLYEDKVNNVISETQFIVLANNFNTNEKRYNDQLKNINNDIAISKEKELNTDNLERIFNKNKVFKNLNRIIVDEFIEKIYIGKFNKELNTRNIQIKWKF